MHDDIFVKYGIIFVNPQYLFSTSKNTHNHLLHPLYFLLNYPSPFPSPCSSGGDVSGAGTAGEGSGCPGSGAGSGCPGCGSGCPGSGTGAGSGCPGSTG